MRFLVITHAYAPMIFPRAFRWAAIAEHWVRQGHQVDVLCGWRPGFSRHEVLKGVRVFRVGGAVVEVLQGWFGRTVLRPDTGIVEPTIPGRRTAQMPWLSSLAKWVYDRTWKKVYWPDYACLWYFSAVQAGKRLFVTNRYEGMISVSLPFTGHLVGLRLKSQFLQTPWVVDIGDPFSFQEDLPTNNYNLYRKINHCFEKKILEEADAVTVTAESALKEYAGLFHIDSSKIYVIPPLISPLTDQEAQDSVFSGGQRIRLVFVGKLYKRVRSPDFLLRLFVELLQTHLGDKLELHFFGDTSDCQDAFKSYQSLFGKKVFFYGQVSHQKALQAMKKADVLVNIGNSTPYQLPSKVVEYVSTGRPILHIAKTDVDGSGEFFKAYPASLCLLDTTGPPDSGQIAAVVQFVERTSPVDLPTLGHWLSQFQTGAIASSYEKIFKP